MSYLLKNECAILLIIYNHFRDKIRNFQCIKWFNGAKKNRNLFKII